MFAPKAGNDQQAILVESFRFFAGEFPGNGLAQNPDGLAAVLQRSVKQGAFRLGMEGPDEAYAVSCLVTTPTTDFFLDDFA